MRAIRKLIPALLSMLVICSLLLRNEEDEYLVPSRYREPVASRRALCAMHNRGDGDMLVHRTAKDTAFVRPDKWIQLGFRVRDTDDAMARQDMIEIYKYKRAMLDTYDSLATSVQKADMWRYAIVEHCGGLYADEDVFPTPELKPFLKRYSPATGLLVFHEACGNQHLQKVQTALGLHTIPVVPQFKQSIFYAAPQATALRCALHRIQHPIRYQPPLQELDATLWRTGPPMFTTCATKSLDSTFRVRCSRQSLLFQHVGRGTWKR